MTRWIVTTPDGVTHRVRTPEAVVLLVRRGGVVVPLRAVPDFGFRPTD